LVLPIYYLWIGKEYRRPGPVDFEVLRLASVFLNVRNSHGVPDFARQSELFGDGQATALRPGWRKRKSILAAPTGQSAKSVALQTLAAAAAAAVVVAAVAAVVSFLRDGARQRSQPPRQ
jgi:hypothetical protein